MHPKFLDQLALAGISVQIIPCFLLCVASMSRGGSAAEAAAAEPIDFKKLCGNLREPKYE
jgi:hypothetical protein